MIAFDDDDNLLETQVGAIHLSDNVFDGGEEIRIEYPGLGTEFYIINDDDDLGWKRGRTLQETARNIASIINRTSNLVHASQEGTSVTIELRDDRNAKKIEVCTETVRIIIFTFSFNDQESLSCYRRLLYQCHESFSKLSGLSITAAFRRL